MFDDDTVYVVLRNMLDLEKLSAEELEILDVNGLIVKIKTNTGWKYVFNNTGIFFLTLAAKVQNK